MASERMNARQKSAMVAFCGMAAGLSVVVMLLGGVIPIATYAVPMLCGTLPQVFPRCMYLPVSRANGRSGKLAPQQP